MFCAHNLLECIITNKIHPLPLNIRGHATDSIILRFIRIFNIYIIIVLDLKNLPSIT